jgi:hypothetical protein
VGLTAIDLRDLGPVCKQVLAAKGVVAWLTVAARLYFYIAWYIFLNYFFNQIFHHVRVLTGTSTTGAFGWMDEEE